MYFSLSCRVVFFSSCFSHWTNDERHQSGSRFQTDALSLLSAIIIVVIRKTDLDLESFAIRIRNGRCIFKTNIFGEDSSWL